MYKQPINEIQANILQRLRSLASGKGLNFAKINELGVSSDQFSYHLRQLQRKGLITKQTDNSYSLSVKGKSDTPLIASHDKLPIAQGYVATRIIISRLKDGKEHFLLQERSVNPQREMLSTPGGKIMAGSTTVEAAKYYTKRQTGLETDVALKGVVHYLDDFQGELVQDRYFFIFRATNPSGTLLLKGPRGKNVWLSYEEIKNSTRALQGLLSLIDIANSDSLMFEEKQFTLEDF